MFSWQIFPLPLMGQVLAKYLLSDGDSSLVHSPYLELLKSTGGLHLTLRRDETFSNLKKSCWNPDQVQGLYNLQHDPHFLALRLLHHIFKICKEFARCEEIATFQRCQMSELSVVMLINGLENRLNIQHTEEGLTNSQNILERSVNP